MAAVPVIDFHTHVLPGMDDGSDSVETSVEMLRRTRAAGTELVVASSHYYRRKESITAFLERRAQSLGKLRPALDRSCSGVIPGAEVAFYFGIAEDAHIGELCIGDTKTLLVEMPFQSWGAYEINQLSSLCYDRRLTVVLAHYERYAEFQKDNAYYGEVLKLPLIVQINASSLTAGLRAKRWLGMFRDGTAHILGSDCHNLDSRPPDLDRGREVIRKKLGEEVLFRADEYAAELLMGRNPRRSGV